MSNGELSPFDDILSGLYGLGIVLTGLAVFLGGWGYCALTYGLWGFVLGWIPSGILAVVVGFLWPLFAGGALWFFMMH
jgi:hypothetical protein